VLAGSSAARLSAPATTSSSFARSWRCSVMKFARSAPWSDSSSSTVWARCLASSDWWEGFRFFIYSLFIIGQPGQYVNMRSNVVE